MTAELVAALVGGGVAALVTASGWGVAWWVQRRVAGAEIARAAADAAQVRAEHRLAEIGKEYSDARGRYEAQLKVLRADIAALEEEAAACLAELPGGVRSAMDSLFSHAATREILR